MGTHRNGAPDGWNMSKTFSISPFHAGISNQKLAVIGLCCACRSENARFHAPRLIDFYAKKALNAERKLSDIFDEADFHNILDEFCIVHGQDSADVEHFDALDMFKIGTRRLKKAGRGADGDMPLRLLGALRPAPRLADTIGIARERLKASGIGAGVQLRIERDWQKYYVSALETRVDCNIEEIPLAAERIFEKVEFSLARKYGIFYATCDERKLERPISDIKRAIKDRFGYDLVFKGDLFGDIVGGLTPLEASMLDFEIAQNFHTYIGITRSTFFNLSALTKYARTGSIDSAYLIYNASGQFLHQRIDNGRNWAVPDVIAPDDPVIANRPAI